MSDCACGILPSIRSSSIRNTSAEPSTDTHSITSLTVTGRLKSANISSLAISWLAMPVSLPVWRANSRAASASKLPPSRLASADTQASMVFSSGKARSMISAFSCASIHFTSQWLAEKVSQIWIQPPLASLRHLRWSSTCSTRCVEGGVESSSFNSFSWLFFSMRARAFSTTTRRLEPKNGRLVAAVCNSSNEADFPSSFERFMAASKSAPSDWLILLTASATE